MFGFCSNRVPLPGCSRLFRKYWFKNATPSLLTPATWIELGIPILGNPGRESLTIPAQGFSLLYILPSCGHICLILLIWRNWGSHRGQSVGGFAANIDSKLANLCLIDDQHHLWGKSASFWIVLKLLVAWWVTGTELLQNCEWHATSRCLCTLTLPWKTGYLAHTLSLSPLQLYSSQEVPSWGQSRCP